MQLSKPFKETTFSNHPFPLLLFLEWILLGITLLTQIRPAPPGFNVPPLLLSLPLLIIFGAMGLRLPNGRTWIKVLYTALEFGLIYLTFLLDVRTSFFSLLGLIIVIRSCLIFPRVGRLIVSGLAYLVFILMQLFIVPHRPPRFNEVPESFANTLLTLKLNTIVTFGLALWFVLLLVNALITERQSREKLLQANDQLRQYALRIEDQATLQERNRIAREIHDALGHTLTAQSIQLENALLFLPSDLEKTQSFLQESVRLGARALQEVRRSISALRSNPLQGQSLESAIASLVSGFYQTNEILPHCVIHLSRPIPANISTALYRIIQEALTNIAKHSTATEINISLQDYQDTIHLQVDDNGEGFDPVRNTTGFGLQGMQERSMALEGQFLLVSQPGKGCRIAVSIPLPQLVL
jgi:signal transduction histidine kinase